MSVNWIEEAMKHFKENGNSEYKSGDDISKKSQEINEKLKNTLIRLVEDDNEVLNLQGSKWNLQGHLKLKDYIWYRIAYKEFGKNYPVVFGIALGKEGLNLSIQIYNDAIGNYDISENLGSIIKDTILNKKIDLDEADRLNPNEKYMDFGYFGLTKFSEDKFKKILQIYKEIVYEINQNIFDKVFSEFNKFLEKPSDIAHLNFKKDGDFYTNKNNIKTNFDKFMANPIFENLDWWDKSINSANMRGNRTNLIKSIEKLTYDEVKKLDGKSQLGGLKDKFEEIKKLIYNEDKIKDEINFEDIENGIKNIEGMNATARELAYYIQMDEDKIPLVNGMTIDVINHIQKVTKVLDNNNNNLKFKIDTIKDKIKLSNDFIFKSYYVIDQLLNLLHKVSKKDLIANNENKKLYEYAYLFSNLTGKADKKPVEKDEFLEMIRKGKNIIYYGAPGTGKTFVVKSNIENIVEDTEKQFTMTQFHPSYSYEDFIEGVKPSGLVDGVMSFELRNGEFKNFCEKAQNEEKSFLNEKDFNTAISKYGYFFFVDEINRAELSRVFGELLYSLEYRGKEGKIKTQYSSLKNDNEYFYIPENLFFIGTMNDVDRSIDSFDMALRRRFIWIRKDCEYQVILNNIEDDNKEKYKVACEKLNKYIINIDGLGEKYQIGHAYFLKIKNYINRKITQKSMNDLFEFHIEPLLTEYLRATYDEKDINKHLEEARKEFKI